MRQQLVSKSQDLNDDVDYLTYRRTSRTTKNYSLKDIIDGNLDSIIENLQILERTELLKASSGTVK